MARFGNVASADGGEDCASFLFCVGALGIAALPDVGRKLPEGQGQVLFFKKVEAFKVEHCKAGSVRKVAAVFPIGQGIELGDTRGVLSALDAAADLSRLQLQIWEQAIEERGLANARCARKGGDGSAADLGNAFLKCCDGHSLPHAKDLKARAAVDIGKPLCHIGRELAFGNDNYGLDVVVLGNGDKLVHRFKHGIGGGCRKGDE